MSENKKYYIVGNSECYIVGNREGCPWDQSHLRRWTDHWDGRPRHVLRWVIWSWASPPVLHLQITNGLWNPRLTLRSHQSNLYNSGVSFLELFLLGNEARALHMLSSAINSVPLALGMQAGCPWIFSPLPLKFLKRPKMRVSCLRLVSVIVSGLFWQGKQRWLASHQEKMKVIDNRTACVRPLEEKASR